MYRVFGYSLTQVIAAFFLSCTIASVVCAAAAPDGASHGKVAINRVNKGDRLQLNPALPVNSARTIPNKTMSAPVNVPPGCEPTFSPVADPEQPRAVRRCLT